MKKIFSVSVSMILVLLIVLTLLLCISCDERIDYEKERKGDIATPTFSPKSGVYHQPQVVTISCDTEGATIRYTLDGSEPTQSSTVYSEPIEVNTGSVVKAKAFKVRCFDSETAKAEYSFQVATPTFEPAGGLYHNSQEITISCITEGAIIRYTTDGNKPDTLSQIYTEPLPINKETILKARAFRSGWVDDEVEIAEYIFQVATPAFDPPGGLYHNSLIVAINCETESATIRYTTDGSEPDTLSHTYTDPLPIDKETMFKAKAFRSGWAEMETVSAEYQFQAATPTFNPPSGTYNQPQTISIICVTKGAIIRYTLDGSEPTQSSTIYNKSIELDSGVTLKAKAFKTGWLDSEVGIAEYKFQTATPTFDPSGGTYNTAQNVTISCVTDGAIICYTTNGVDPTPSSPVYSKPINVTEAITLKAKAFKAGWNDSPVASSSYLINKIELIHVPDGTFTMGRTKGTGLERELPTHSVTLNSFYIGKYLVTQKDYKEVMGSNPASGYGVGDNYPVYFVSWYSAIKFCNLLSIKERLTPVYNIGGSTNPANWGSVPTYDNSTWNAAVCNWDANGYRLPTEAEWEYAARGGTSTPDYFYSGSDDLGKVAWYFGNISPYGTKPVGGKAANRLGIYDMSGNLWEWCWDWYDDLYYSSSPSSNPTGSARGSYRVLRGGYWGSGDNSCRVANRSSSYPDYSYNRFGIRLCRTAK